ncbi:MAG: proliferating cell nuclear antigen (pcna) [archaeon]|nr:proliferating cell nuclear antigen (pcna) [archaeon]
MHLVFDDASVFKRFVDGIAVLVDEAEFVIDENGLGLKATDPSQISLVDFRLPKKGFSKFDAKEATKIGLDLNYLSQVVSRAKSSDKIELLISGDNSTLKIIFVGKSKRSFDIPLLDISTSDLPLPRIDFESEVKVRADALSDSFKDANLISTHITLSIEDDYFKVRASSSKGKLENVYGAKDEGVIALKATEPTSAMFPLDYMVSIIKAASSDTEVTLKLKTNAPVEVQYSVGEGRFTYFLAPRIESD